MAIWTLKEAADYLSMTPTELSQLGEAGPPTHYRGSKVSFFKDEVVRFREGKQRWTQAYTPPIRAEPPKDKDGLVSIIVGALLRCIPGLELSPAKIAAENVLGELRAHRVGMFRKRERE